MTPFKSTHNLHFEVAEHPDWLNIGQLWKRFRVGTCEGLWRCADDAYEILAIDNKKPGNGHFEDVLEWFYNSCRRDKKGLRFCELLNDNFKKHLITKRGFVKEGPNVIKRYRKIKNDKL